MSGSVRVVDPSLVVLIGPSGSGKSTWAEAQFGAHRVVSSDRLRALVGEGEDDQRASVDAFSVLLDVVERRAVRRLTTVVDTLGTDRGTRQLLRRIAAAHSMTFIAVVFDEPPAVCRRRNRERSRRVPEAVLDTQLAAWPQDLEQVRSEDFDLVMSPVDVRLVPASLATADGALGRQLAEPMPLSFGLHLGSHAWSGGPTRTAETLRRVAGAAEEAGFTGIWVMDHLRQIPQNGPEWGDLLESWTTLAFLAGVTTKVRLGTLVTGITYRNVAHLGKIVASLDVLSGGRAVCGLGAAWFEKEHVAYGYPFPSARVRLDLLEDALQLLPLLWGKGAPAFQGKVLNVPEAMCYPRPLQQHVPLLVGGMGERRTLRLAATYADACNLTGDVDRVRHKVQVLRAHIDAAGRDHTAVEVTHLSTALVADDVESLQQKVKALKPSRMSAARFDSRNHPGTVEDHIGRFRELAEVGVSTAMVSLPDVDDPSAVPMFAKVIAAFR